MHEYDNEARAIQRRSTTSAEPAEGSQVASHSPIRAPRSVHGEASLLHLQRTAGNQSVVQMLADEAAMGADDDRASPVHDVIGKGGGSRLDEGTRSSMESRFGQDFSAVRVHTDGRASASAEAVGANAYTVGNDMVFRSGHFDAVSPTGQRTIAHELSHVVQQRSGPVDGTEAPGGIRLSDPSDRFERAAETSADQVMSASAAPASSSTGAGTAVQLEEAGDAETVQREFVVQRGIIMEEAEQDEEGSSGG